MLSTLLLSTLALVTSVSAAADPAPIGMGSRVLVKGLFQRKCSAQVVSMPAPGLFRLSFDRPRCGDAGQPYELKQLQRLAFVAETKLAASVLKSGDEVVLQGFQSKVCAGRVKELTRSGYVALDFDSLLCADTEALRKVSELTKVSYISTLQDFNVGQKISTPGIAENESCNGTISRLTSNGFAAIDFEQLTCAHAGSLFSLAQLKKIAAPAPKRTRITGAAIFQRVMREIASSKAARL